MLWTFGDFELDDHAYTLRRAGEPIVLRRKVFEVLRYLVAHSGALVTKEELLCHVWPGEAIIEAVIPQNISILRRLLRDSRQAAALIQTVHGKGYRFTAQVKTLPHRQPPMASGAGQASVELVGRERALSTLDGLLQRMLLGHGQTAFIEGEAGVGKTRLTQELAQRARERACLVCVAQCQDTGGALPYRPWVEILRQLLALNAIDPADAGPDVQPLLREPWAASPAPVPADPAAANEARFRLFHGVTRLLERGCRERPLLLLFDDLHWADPASLHLLSFVSSGLRMQPVLIVGAARPGDPLASSATASELGKLASATHTRRVPIVGLSEAESARLIAHGLGRALAPELVSEIVAFTEGNPFFLLELVRLLSDAPCTEDADRLRIELPRRLRDVVLLRVQRLGVETQRVLMLAAVIGCSFRLPVLELLAELPRQALLELLSRACQARLLHDYTSFSHALIQEALYDAIDVPRRAELHRRVGHALEAVLGVEADANPGELAQHFLAAAISGEAERAVRYCQRAAEQACQRLAFEQAVTYYQDALTALVTRMPVDEVVRYQLKLGLGTALFRSGRDGTTELQSAAEIARELARPALLAQVVLALSGWPRLRRRGRTDNPALYPLLCEALASAELQTSEHAGLRARLLSTLALNTPETTPLCEQIALSKQALEVARGSQDPDVLYDALVARLYLMGGPAELAERQELAQELLALADRSQPPERRFQARELCIQTWLALGRVPRAERAIAECERIARQLGSQRYALQVLRFQLQRALGEGDFAAVRSLTREARALHVCAPSSPNELVGLYVWQSFERAWCGDRAYVERHIAALFPKVEASRLLRAHLAALCAAAGRAAEARRCYVPLLERSVLDDDTDDDWLLTLIWVAEAAAACADRPAARALYERLAPYAQLNVTHVEWRVYFGSCARWLGLLASLLGEHEAAAAHFEAALAANERLGARPALALCCLDFARACARLPAARTRERSLIARASSLANELGMHALQRELAQLQTRQGCATEAD